MNTGIQILQKPSTVSWLQVKNCLMEAHAQNREKGIVMSHPLWPPEQIGAFVEESGVMFVAMDGEKLVGTLGVKERTGNYWFTRDSFGYLCFGSLLPDYRGQGIYKALNDACEAYIRQKGYQVFALDTHVKNRHMQEISLRSGFRLVRFYHVSGDLPHNCVMMAKWVDACPYSAAYCKWQFFVSKLKAYAKIIISLGK